MYPDGSPESTAPVTWSVARAESDEQGAKRPRAMTYALLLVSTHLAKRPARQLVRGEVRIVAEPAAPTRHVDDTTVHFASTHQLATVVRVRRGAHIVRATIARVPQCLEQETIVFVV